MDGWDSLKKLPRVTFIHIEIAALRKFIKTHAFYLFCTNLLIAAF